MPRTVRDPFDDPAAAAAAGRFGLRLFLLSLGVLFAATLIGMTVARLFPTTPGRWIPAEAPPLPWGLLLSTATLVVSSITLIRARSALRHDDTQGLARWMIVTLGLACAFLLLQGACWITLVRAHMTFTGSLYGWLFYVLTGLHALHVLGGMVPMAVVTRRAVRGWYDASNRHGVEMLETYWHFLGVVWLVLYASLAILR
jgi:cytochrome c oxidase subunit III